MHDNDGSQFQNHVLHLWLLVPTTVSSRFNTSTRFRFSTKWSDFCKYGSNFSLSKVYYVHHTLAPCMRCSRSDSDNDAPNCIMMFEQHQNSYNKRQRSAEWICFIPSNPSFSRTLQGCITIEFCNCIFLFTSTLHPHWIMAAVLQHRRSSWHDKYDALEWQQ